MFTRSPWRRAAGLLMVTIVAACSHDAAARRRDTAVSSGDVNVVPVRTASITDDSSAQPVTATAVIALRDEITLGLGGGAGRLRDLRVDLAEIDGGEELTRANGLAFSREDLSDDTADLEGEGDLVAEGNDPGGHHWLR